MQHGAETAARCPHADPCGGCAFQACAYSDQVAAKNAALRQLWHAAGAGEGRAAAVFRPHADTLTVTPSPDHYEYRTRMDYVATKGRFGLRMRGRWNYVVELETCHLIPPFAFEVSHSLWQRAIELGLPDYHVRTHAGFLRYIVVRRSPANTLLLAAVTAAGSYEPAMEELANQALSHPAVVGFHWLLNDTLTDLSTGSPLRAWGSETLPMQVEETTLHIGPNTFFQNNVHLLIPLLNAVTGAVVGGGTGTAALPASVADLYGGAGLIGLHLARRVPRVVIVESHDESARLAHHNSTLNGTTNIRIATSDVAPFLQEQTSGSFDCVVADPPRTGMGEHVCADLLRLAPRRIVYLSCNPLTQIEDIRLLAARYTIAHVQGYDMFPHTPHVEMLAVLDCIDHEA